MSTFLINNLGGPSGFGENFLAPNDDESTSFIDIFSVFPQGLNFFGTVWTGLFFNNNGNLTFAFPQSNYTPFAITGSTSNPLIAPFFADVDTRGTPGGLTPGGTSTGTNRMWYDLDPLTGTITVTWDDVGYYSNGVNKLNAFQLQLVRVDDSDFDIVFRYEDINWTTGSASGGSNGLGGTVARAGYSSGDGLNYFELPQSGNQDAILNLESSSNIATPGTWIFQVRNGSLVIAASISDALLVEGNGPGTTTMLFDVFLSAPSSLPVQIDYFTQTGTATGTDFIPVAGTIVFAPGQTRQVISVEIIGDTLAETDETFSISLGNHVNVLISDGHAVGTIINDDGLVINDVSVIEGTGSGTTTATFTVTLLSPSTSPVTVKFATQGGTAQEGIDFTGTMGTLVFAAGETSKTITVEVARDAQVESNEAFTVLLSDATGSTIADGVGQGTIVNDDGFVVNDVTLFEGSGSGTSPFVFNVTLLSALTQTATVDYQVVGGTATAGSDFIAATGTLTFTAGQTLQQVTVQVNRDSLVESDETFQLLLSNATVVGIADASGIGTIRNDDGLQVANASVVEGDDGNSSLFFTVTLSSATNTQVSVDYSTVAGTASEGSDYLPVTGTLTFAPGQTSHVVEVLVNGDTEQEATETLVLELFNPIGTGIIGAIGLGTIGNDDGLIVLSPGLVEEGDSGTSTVVFEVVLSSAAEHEVTVDYTTTDGTATAGVDYVAASGSLTFAPGETSKTVHVTINGDTQFEPNETLRLVLFNPLGSLIVIESGTVTIENDDTQPAPIMYISDVSQTEGTGTENSAFNFFVTLSRAATQTVTVNYATHDGSATAPADYMATSGTLTFNPGETSKVVTVHVVRDAIQETNETFLLELSGISASATLGDTTGVGTILNDDVAVSVNDASLTEGNSETSSVVFTITLSGASPLPVSVDYSTSDGTATASTDYLASTGTVTFAPGETSKEVVLQVNGDLTFETDESFQLVLSNPVYATIDRAEGTATIVNDDTLPTLSVNDVSVPEGDSGSTNAAITVTLSVASEQTVTVNYLLLNSAPTLPIFAAKRGTLTFAPGETSQEVLVKVAGDQKVEKNQLMLLALSNPQSATIERVQGTLTIVDDDAPAPLAMPFPSQFHGYVKFVYYPGPEINQPGDDQVSLIGQATGDSPWGEWSL